MSAGLYPSLHERFSSEGVCSICLLEMGSMPRFSCDNSHAICQRCRAYFFNCPQCLQPLHEQLASHGQLMSHPPPPAAAGAAGHQQPWTLPYPPSAPNLEDFHEHERAAGLHYPRNPQRALTNADLIECPYSRLGCTAKFVAELRDMHASRCQYRHERDDEQQQQHIQHMRQVCPAALYPPSHETIACRYQGQGCNVRLAAERLRGHEEICIYKDRAEQPSPSSSFDCSQAPTGVGDVCCRYESLGCNVRLPHWRLMSQHEDMCVHRDERCRPSWGPQPCVAAERSCRYQPVGCNVRMPPGRLHGHEDICIYKDRY